MEGFVAQKLNDFENGKISRRKLIETLTVAATTAYASGAAAADPALKLSVVNHVSYTCPDFKQAADWYSKVFNLEQVGPSKRNVVLPFGKSGEKPYGVTAADVPLTHLVIRTANPNGGSADGGAPKAKPEAVIDHVAYTVADFDQARMREQLKALGVANLRDYGPTGLHMDDPFGYHVEICGLANTALTDG